MLDEPLEVFSRQRLLKELSEKALIFFIILIVKVALFMLIPFVVGHVIDKFELPVEWMQYSWIVVHLILCAIMITLALQSELPGAIFIGIIAFKTLLFSCILYLISYAIKNFVFNEKT